MTWRSCLAHYRPTSTHVVSDCYRFLLLRLQPEKCPVVVAHQESEDFRHYARFRRLILFNMVEHGLQKHLAARVFGSATCQ